MASTKIVFVLPFNFRVESSTAMFATWKRTCANIEHNNCILLKAPQTESLCILCGSLFSCYLYNYHRMVAKEGERLMAKTAEAALANSLNEQNRNVNNNQNIYPIECCVLFVLPIFMCYFLANFGILVFFVIRTLIMLFWAQKVGNLLNWMLHHFVTTFLVFTN